MTTWTPADIDKITQAFPANIMHLMPAYAEIPAEYKQRHHPMVQIFSRWFYKGLPAGTGFRPKPGIDRDKALIHIKTVMGSFQPKHEHKEAGVAFLLDQWFAAVSLPDEKRTT